MKILRIIARLNVGGPARHVVWLTAALRDDEFESKLISGTVPPGEEDMSYLAAANGIEPVYIQEMSRELSAKDVVSLWKIFQVMRREKPAIIHTHTAKAGTVGRIAAFFYRWLAWGTLIGKPRRVRVVHTFHGHVFHSYYGTLKTRLFLIIEKALARFATDKIIVITPQQYDEIHRDFRIGGAEKFEVIPLGIDLAAYENPESKRDIFRGELGVADDELLIGFVGRLTEIKNLSLFLKVAAICRQQHGALKARFVIVGDGHLRADLEAEAAKLGVAETVVFAGNRDDADIIYAGLDVIALTSLNEGTPLSLIEAMASRRPVISTAVGGVVDLLGAIDEELDGFSVCERGISAPSNSPEDFAKGLIYLMKNERLRERLGMRGKEYVDENYGIERLVGDIKELYRRLI